MTTATARMLVDFTGQTIPQWYDAAADVYRAISDTFPLPERQASQYPQGATAITAASGNVANASAVATLAGAASKTTYITGFEITGSGATGAAIVVPTVAGSITGTLTYIQAVVAGALLGNTPLVVQFDPPIPASAANTAIVVTVPALGVGNTNSAVVAHGYQL